MLLISLGLTPVYDTREVDGMMDLTRIENGEINKIDPESMSAKTEKKSSQGKKGCYVKKMYTCYQNLWTAFVANNNIENEYDDVALLRFFQSIQERYSQNTLWVIYSCINSRFIDNYGVNMKGLLSLHKYIKQQTQLDVATKSKTFSTKEIETILMYLQDKNESKET